MDDAEAEAVLLVLGPQLEWIDAQGWAFAHMQEYDIEYQVRQQDDGLWQALRADPDGYRHHYPLLTGPLFQTEQAAKLACEIFCQMGQWECKPQGGTEWAIRWVSPFYDYSDGTEIFPTKDGYYQVRLSYTTYEARFHKWGHQTPPCSRKDLAAAKAACERHHATGKWE